MLWSNPLLALCRSRGPVSPIRRPTRLTAESLELRCVPATFTISNFNDGGLGTGSLRSAVIQANTTYQFESNTINLNAGTYKLSLTGGNEDKAATGDLDITGETRLTIQGAGASKTIIDAQQIDRVFQIVGPDARVTFRNLTITGGKLLANSNVAGGFFYLQGGGILNSGGNVTLDGVTVRNNSVSANIESLGGGVSSDGGFLTIQNSTITNNTVSYHTEYLFDLSQLNGDDGADAPDEPFSTDPPKDGDMGKPGQSGLDGTSAIGGGIAGKNARIEIYNTTISSNQAIGSAGSTAGRGGDGGDGGVNNLSAEGHGGGGRGGDGGSGGKGGDAYGAAVATNGGTLKLDNITVTGNTALGGDGGVGGGGGDGGYANGSGTQGNGGDGGAGGAGGFAGAAVFAKMGTVTVSGTSKIEGNTAIAGRGGDGNYAGMQSTFLSDAGTGGVGGAGGAIRGAGIAIAGGNRNDQQPRGEVEHGNRWPWRQGKPWPEGILTESASRRPRRRGRKRWRRWSGRDRVWGRRLGC